MSYYKVTRNDGDMITTRFISGRRELLQHISNGPDNVAITYIIEPMSAKRYEDAMSIARAIANTRRRIYPT